MGSVQEEIQELRDRIEALAERHDEESSRGSNGLSAKAQNDPRVQQAAVALAKAIADAEGYDLPMQVAGGEFGQLPVMVLPEEFQKYGGIGIGVMVAPPTEAARNA